jgi:hypothetical protein
VIAVRFGPCLNFFWCTGSGSRESGLFPLGNTLQAERNEQVKAGNPSASGSSFSSEQKYVPGNNRPAEDELYSFRAAIAEPVPSDENQPARPKVSGRQILALLLLLAAIAGLLVYGGSTFFKSKQQPLYTDLGTERYDPAGLGGRLIAQWTGAAGYKFTIDPLDPAQVPGFAATIANPPHAITFKLTLKDATDGVECEKDIVIPGVPEGQGAFDKSAALAPRAIPTGDTLQDVAGHDGQIGEMVLTGSLGCNLDAFKKVVAWQFVTDFPPLTTQKDWEKHEDSVLAESKKAKSGGSDQPQSIGGYIFVKSLPNPVESDDVIVSDNPAKGIVATSSGRAFLVGTKILVNPALDWQVFPADIHYRCERNAMCMVTRLSSRTAVRAHLMK